MINEIKEFNILILDEVINYISSKNDNLENLVDELGFSTYKNVIGTVLIEPRNKIFNKIVLSINENSLKSISFYGFLSIRFSDLIDVYGEYKEIYSAHDDIYFYFFEKNEGISILYRSENKMNANSNNYLKQISIDLK